MAVNKNAYKKLTDLAKQVLNQKQVPLYRTKFSKKEFTTYQLLVLLFAKTYENKGYRAFVEFLEASKLPNWLRLKKIPHFTTLQKFAERLNVQFLESLLIESASVKAFDRAGVDGTGLTFRNPSRHYEKRVGKLIKKKDFLKCTIVSDLDHQLILAVKMRKKARHDTLDFLPLWNKVKKIPFKWFYMDRGYDADYCHQAIYDAGKISFGDLKYLHLPIWRTRGPARKRAKKHRIHRKKNWRALTESINKAIKAKFSSVVNAKKLHTQKVEVLLKLITYNLYRRITRNIIFCVLKIAHKFGQFFNCLSSFLLVEQKSSRF